jgi:hypothetical protein
LWKIQLLLTAPEESQIFEPLAVGAFGRPPNETFNVRLTPGKQAVIDFCKDGDLPT